MKVSEMKELMKNANLDELRKLAADWEQDERAGVQKLALSARKKIAAFEEEVKRTYAMQEYESMQTADIYVE